MGAGRLARAPAIRVHDIEVMKMRFALKAAAVPVLVVTLALGLRAAPSGYGPALKAVVNAANAGDPDSTRRSTVDGRAIPWIPTAEGLTIRKYFQPKPWEAATLDPPFTLGGPLAIFHTWHAPESDGDHLHPLVKTSGGWKLGPEISERNTQGYRITHHVLTVHILPSKKRAEISDSFTVIPHGKPLKVAFIRFSDDFHVRELKSAGRQIAFRQAGGIVAVRMPQAPSVTLDMKYDGTVDHRALSGVTKDLAVLSAYYYPTLGRLPSTADVTAIVPKGWSAVTQGELAKRTNSGAETAFTFHNPLPVNYFTLDAARYTITQRKVGGKTLYAYLLKAKPGFADKLLDSVQEAMPYFEKRFGPYPFSRYSVVDGGAIMGFVALEGYSMASYGTMTLTPNVLAHELSHTWWGGVVPNTYLRSWWNESFARYSDDAFSHMSHKMPDRHPKDQPWWPPAASVEAAPLSTARDESSVNSIAYEKGRVVLDLLEEQIGPQQFDQCIQAFVKRERSALDPDWPDFERTVENVTHQKLDWFFKQWVTQTGWPSLRFGDIGATRDYTGAWTIRGHIVRDGDDYQLDVPVRMVGLADSTVKDAADRKWPDGDVGLQGSSTPFEYTVDVLPGKMLLDPDLTIPRVMSEEDVAEFDKTGHAILLHSREERQPSPFGGM